MTIASSLAITRISSIGAIVGKLSTGQVPFFPSLNMVMASLISAPLGAAGNFIAWESAGTDISRYVLRFAKSIRTYIDIKNEQSSGAAHFY